MKTEIKFLLLVLLGTLTGPVSFAQNTPQAYTLQQAIDFALQNQQRIAIARNEVESAKARIGEIRAIGLPQINASTEVGNNFVIQKSPLPVDAFTPLNYTLTQDNINQANSGEKVVLQSERAELPPGSPKYVYLGFGQPWTGTAAITGSQLLFDGSYLIGLQAASTFSQLSKKQLVQTEIEVTEMVSKAYYGVLVSQARRELLEQNLRRLDTLLYQTKELYKNGFAEKLDVDRLT
ncbi:MAG TPA: TolC family protein, partial [Adhaeribacter sp.]|nr:TolC family protein [Adhaeribacter sp.]